jgi:hypothetical protein
MLERYLDGAEAAAYLVNLGLKTSPPAALTPL